MNIPLRNKLREIVAYAIIDDGDSWVCKWSWYRNKYGYASRTSHGAKRKCFHVLLHRQILSPPGGMFIDHIGSDSIFLLESTTTQQEQPSEA